MKRLRLSHIGGVLLAGIAATVAAVACSSSSDEGPADGAAPPADGSLPDGGTVGDGSPADAFGFDASDTSTRVFGCVWDAGAGDGSVCYNDLADPSKWASYVPVLSPALDYFDGVGGGGFDGRYVYIVSSVVARYDTQGTFASASSWASFDTKTVSKVTNAIYAGAAFDGRYLYLVPVNNGATFMKYDTTASFGDPASWVSYPAGGQFVGAVFDGRYLYYLPITVLGNKVVYRYDTQGAFTSAGSWTTFDLTGLHDDYYQGGIFDGRYVYMVPQNVLGVMRYDTQASFTSASSWTLYNAGAWVGYFYRGAYDGRNLYITPGNMQDAAIVAQEYDTTAPFLTPSSWSNFDVTGVAPGATGFAGAAFDGRRIVYGPAPKYASDGGGTPLVLSYDSQSTLTNTGAWESYDVRGSGGKGASCSAAVFDGEYIYFIPATSTATGAVLRFDAKSPPSMPKWYSGSFY